MLVVVVASMLTFACGSVEPAATGTASVPTSEPSPVEQLELAEPTAPAAARGARDVPPTAPAEAAEPAVAPTAAPLTFGTPLPRAPIGVDALAPEPIAAQPVSLQIDELDIIEAPVVPVGVNPDDTLEVPAADEVGWYRFGPSPGVEGSSVLAAHIAYDGVDGVFRSLSEVEAGTLVTIGFDDGSRERFRIVSVTDYFKDELPDSLFAREGKPQLALITCGGAFNPNLRSYDSNTVAIAVPA